MPPLHLPLSTTKGTTVYMAVFEYATEAIKKSTGITEDFICTDGGSNKFWCIRHCLVIYTENGLPKYWYPGFITAWGKNHYQSKFNPHFTIKTYNNLASASKEYSKIIHSKVVKGYVREKNFWNGSNISYPLKGFSGIPKSILSEVHPQLLHVVLLTDHYF